MEDERCLPIQIAQTIRLFLPPGGVAELRAIGTKRGKISGYFSSRQAMFKAACALSGHAEGIYCTINPVDPELLHRANNRLEQYARTTTSDDEILSRRWFVIDVDPERPRGISSTDAEQQIAVDRAKDIRSFLAARGWPAPYLAASGNGAHLGYPIREANSPEVRDILRAALLVIAGRFNDERANVDPSMFNASRIVRFYGTQARKGDPSLDRPHRVARFLEIVGVDLRSGDANPVLPLGAIKALVADFPTDRPRALSGAALSPSVPLPPRQTRAGLDMSTLDVVAWFGAHDCYGQCLSETRGAHSVRCPWEEEHSTPGDAHDSDTVMWDGRDNRLPGFRCLHAHCVNRRLQEIAILWDDAAKFGARERTGGDYEMTDDGNTTRLIDRYGDHLRHSSEMGGWMWWDGAAWKRGDKGRSEVHECVRDTIGSMRQEAEQIGDGDRREALLKWCKRSQSAEKIFSIAKLASIRRDVQAKADQFDANPWLLNFANGIVDIRTGEIRANQPDDYVIHLIPHIYNPDARCPRFERFLLEVFAGNVDLIEYIKDLLGYGVTGSVREEIIAFCYGTGSNGKSKLLEIIRRAFGSYVGSAAPGLLMETSGERHPTGLAHLKGKRIMICQEVKEGKRFSEDVLKLLTGGDEITARFMRGDFFEFPPTHKLWLATNHKPIIRDTTHSSWRRLPLIPFTVTFYDPEDPARPEGAPVQDKMLLDALTDEIPGILALVVHHAGKWYHSGLKTPDIVRTATSAYRAEQDALGAFLEERCLLHEDANATAGELYATYKRWTDYAGEYCRSQKAFGQALRERGFCSYKSGAARWRGLRPFTEEEVMARENDSNA